MKAQIFHRVTENSDSLLRVITEDSETQCGTVTSDVGSLLIVYVICLI